MHGILQFTSENNCLYLTSDGQGDAGTYLAIRNYLFKLPLHEYFKIRENQGTLFAIHDMKLFGITFLQIDYQIQLKM